MENRFAARVRRRYFSEGEKRRPEMRLRLAGYVRVGSGVQRDATTHNNVRTCSASWEGYNPQVFVNHA